MRGEGVLLRPVHPLRFLEIPAMNAGKENRLTLNWA